MFKEGLQKLDEAGTLSNIQYRWKAQTPKIAASESEVLSFGQMLMPFVFMFFVYCFAGAILVMEMLWKKCKQDDDNTEIVNSLFTHLREKNLNL